MLSKLSIKNYAIIDYVEINFSDRLNIITGETGAGKSILLGALALVLGKRANSKVLYNDSSKCVVEAIFNIANYKLQAFFKTNNLDYDGETIIRREITPSGKSRAFINDTPVTLDVLTQLSSQLVNLHSQHETLSLNSHNFQLQLVDAIANHSELLQLFVADYTAYKALAKQLAQLKGTDDAGTDIDYVQYQFNELETANLSETEQEELEQELNTLEHAEEIKGALQEATLYLEESEQSVISQLNHITVLLNRVADFDPDISLLNNRVESALIELQDVASELAAKQEDVIFDPSRNEIVTERLNELNRLQSKHQLKSCAELIDLRNQLDIKLKDYDAIRDEIDALEEKVKLKLEAVISLAEKLNTNRLKAVPFLQNQVKKLLVEVGMPNANIEVVIEKLAPEKINISGLNKVTFNFSANKGAKVQELKEVASGGELSRLMLVLKSLVAKHTMMPTLIFDEIDSGVSGEVAYKVGNLLEVLGNQHQLISITHLPQIASKGQCHFFVYKEVINDRTYTQIKALNEQERVEEIAKMLGGKSLTDATIASARELLLT